MNTKLTLRMDEELVRKAKKEARRRGKSVSRMVSEFISAIESSDRNKREIPPVTASLVGLLKGRRISEASYKKHLREKYS